MQSMRFSLRTLLVAAATISACLAAIASGSYFGEYATTLTLNLLLLGSIPAILYCNRAARAFWIGFAVFGWGCKAVNIKPFNDLVNKNGAVVQEYMFGPPPDISTIPPSEIRRSRGRIRSPELDAYNEKMNHFWVAVGSVERLAVASCGGFVTVLLFRRRERRKKTSKPRDSV